MENNTNTMNTGVDNSTTESKAKTYTQEELDSIVQSESDRRVTQAIDKYKKKTANEIEEAKRVASMDANEKYAYELQKREDAIAEKERQLTLAENKVACNTVLAEKNIPIQLSDLVLDVDTDVMNQRVSILEKYFNEAVKEEVNKRLSSSTPKNGSTKVETTISKETFKKMSIADRQKLYNNDRDLYNMLNK